MSDSGSLKSERSERNKNKSSKTKYQIGDLKKYLKRHQVLDKGEYTHTSFGNPAGKFYVLSEDRDEFMRIYIKAIKRGEVAHITERHRLVSPIYLDFDFLYTLPKNEETKKIEESKNLASFRKY